MGGGALLSHCTDLWFLAHNSRTNDCRELRLGLFERGIVSALKWVLFKTPESIFLFIFEYICWKTCKFWRFYDHFHTIFTFYNASSMVTMFFLWNKVGAITWYAFKKKQDGKILKKVHYFTFCKWALWLLDVLILLLVHKILKNWPKIKIFRWIYGETQSDS